MNGQATITIAGKTVGLKFGMPAIRRFVEKATAKEEAGEHQLILNDRYTDYGICHLLYAGYANYCLMKDEPVSLGFDAFYDFLESPSEDARAEIVAAVKAFEESKFIKPIVDEKKKAMLSIGTESKPSATGT